VKYSQQTTRPIVMGTNGMVASGHPLASQAGVRVLQDGGNAMDAAVTAAAVLAVTQPEANGVGGDAFLLNYDAAADQLEGLNASGRAPAAANLDAYQDGIPEHGPRSATIPGAVRGWADALERHGSISLADALAPAIRYAEEGFPVSLRLARAMAAGADDLRRCRSAAEAYLKDGQPYEPGELLKLPDLARSLKGIAQDGPDAFYRGHLARTIVEAQQEEGGHFTLEDLAGHDSVLGEPLSVDYRGYQVYNQRPVSIGALLLAELKIVEGFDLAGLPWDSAERIHLLVEAKKLAFADLETHITDPEFADLPLEGLLSPDYAAQRRTAIDRGRAAESYAGGDPARYGSHTTYMAVVDRNGNMVSWIQSLFHRFGSCWMAPGTGILLNDRMDGFSTDPRHINRLEGGKRTAHTLNAPLVFQDGKPCLVVGTPSTYGQVQSNLQMLTNFIDHGLDVQAMIEAPRWLSLDGRKLAVESRYAASTLDGLRELGHEVDVLGDWSDRMGGAQAIRINQQSGALEGGADPRREGYAIGW
jgi:gamma-glutamyltranspeptidase/glutathione hydrolase